MTIIDKSDKTLKFLRGGFSYLFFFCLLPLTHTHTNEKDNLSLWGTEDFVQEIGKKPNSK